LAIIPAIALLASGCSGFNASGSISPATFLLPGLMKADPVPMEEQNPPPPTEPEVIVAQFH
jgi:hypothetical protein